MPKKTEANLISFKVLLNRDNQLITELSMLPEKHIDRLFHVDEAWIIRNVIKKSKDKLLTCTITYKGSYKHYRINSFSFPVLLLL